MKNWNSLTRRTMLKGSMTTATAGLVSSGPQASAAAMQPDAREIAAAGRAKSHTGFRLPFRHIHLDFHTSPAIIGVGSEFNATEFAQILKDARVNSITIFAKCHHGMAYYPTKVGFPHPNLKFDLLGEMIEACHRQSIVTPVYISTLYDQRAWRQHGEWRALLPDGREDGHRGHAGPTVAELGRLCINTGYANYVNSMAEEVVTAYDIDGLFYDNFTYGPEGCSCPNCMLERQKLGLDSTGHEDRIRHMHIVMDRAMQRFAEIVRRQRPKATVYINGPFTLRQGPDFLRSALPYFSHIEIESLPGGSWGYSYYPMAARRLRNLGLQTRGMTGAFHRSWGDFGSVCNQAALDYECFRMLAESNMCSVGDHLHPSGKLNKVTYDRIGKTYRSIEEKEPWCRDGRAVTEIASLITYEGNDGVESDRGAAAMLTQLRMQYDFIDQDEDFSRYKVLMLPDSHRIDGDLESKLRRYLAAGGKLVVSNESGLDPDRKNFALPIGVTYVSPWKHDSQYLELLRPETKGFAPMVEISYETGMAVKTAAGGIMLARCWRPYFDKTYQHFQVEQTPPWRPTEYAAVVATGSTIYFATPLFRTYARYAYAFDRELFGYCLRRLLPKPLVKVGGPSTLEATVTEQEGRRVVHLLNYIPQRRGDGLDVVEDTIPLMNVKLALRSDQKPQSVYLAPGKEVLQFEYSEGYASATVPVVIGHQMIVFQNA